MLKVPLNHDQPTNVNNSEVLSVSNWIPNMQQVDCEKKFYQHVPILSLIHSFTCTLCLVVLHTLLHCGSPWMVRQLTTMSPPCLMQHQVESQCFRPSWCSFSTIKHLFSVFAIFRDYLFCVSLIGIVRIVRIVSLIGCKISLTFH